MELIANEGKNIEITTASGVFHRGVIHTHFVTVGEDYLDLIRRYVLPCYEEGDILSISEKVISLCQKRVIYKKDMRVSPLARFLSGFASHSDAGIGVDSVWKMQFAIDHCGKCRIIWAAVCAGIGKLFGRRGIFYDIAGIEVRGLDGFYDKVFAEYGEYGIMLPYRPSEVCDEIFLETGILSVIVDVNDYTRDILGKCAFLTYTDEQIGEMLMDNPSGQADQLTPFVLIRKKENGSE